MNQPLNMIGIYNEFEMPDWLKFDLQLHIPRLDPAFVAHEGVDE